MLVAKFRLRGVLKVVSQISIMKVQRRCWDIDSKGSTNLGSASVMSNSTSYRHVELPAVAGKSISNQPSISKQNGSYFFFLDEGSIWPGAFSTHERIFIEKSQKYTSIYLHRKNHDIPNVIGQKIYYELGLSKKWSFY